MGVKVCTESYRKLRSRMANLECHKAGLFGRGFWTHFKSLIFCVSTRSAPAKPMVSRNVQHGFSSPPLLRCTGGTAHAEWKPRLHFALLWFQQKLEYWDQGQEFQDTVTQINNVKATTWTNNELCRSNIMRNRELFRNSNLCKSGAALHLTRSAWTPWCRLSSQCRPSPALN
jgi:hypothetical protein